MKYIALLFLIFVTVKAREIKSYKYDEVKLRQQAEEMLSQTKSLSTDIHQMEGNLKLMEETINNSRPDILKTLYKNTKMQIAITVFEDAKAEGRKVELCEKVMKEHISKFVEAASEKLKKNFHDSLDYVNRMLPDIKDRRTLLEYNLVNNLEKELDMCKKDEHWRSDCDLKTEYPRDLNELNNRVEKVFENLKKIVMEIDEFLKDIVNNDDKVTGEIVMSAINCFLQNPPV